MINNSLLEKSVDKITNKYIGLKQLREQREAITNRWSAIGLLDGLEGNIKENCAQLFESQLSWSENNRFTGVAFPIVRRVYANLLAEDLVSVQPIGSYQVYLEAIENFENESYKKEMDDYLS